MSTAMSLLAGLASDLAAILLLAYVVYFRRYHHPGIRRNPWNRTLQRYFAGATRSAPGRDPDPMAFSASSFP